MTELIDKVAWLLTRRGKMLFALTRGRDKFYNIGGKRKQKPDGAWENDAEVLEREVREETGVKIDPATVRHLRTFIGHAPDGRPMREACYSVGKYRGVPEPSGEIVALRWLGPKDKSLTTPMGGQIIDWAVAERLMYE